MRSQTDPPPDRSLQASSIGVVEINDHLLGFYAGRDTPDDGTDPAARDSWVWWGALSLGLCSYAVHADGAAVVFDSMALPEQARWIREHLRGRGADRLALVNSHWHLDHIAGNAVYGEGPIIAHALTREYMVRHRHAMERGELWGPPGVSVALPGITYRARMDIHVGDIVLELHHFAIHSQDGTLLYLPADRIALVGDMLEDTVPFIWDPADVPLHLKELERMKTLGMERILPSHGDPKAIRQGGYAPPFIDAVSGYLSRMMRRADDPGYMESALSDFVGDYVERGLLHYFAPYEETHRQNLRTVRAYREDPRRPPA